MQQSDSFLTEKIIDHYKNPRNYGILPRFTITKQYENSYCGDEITVYLEVKSDKIKDISFEGAGCAICIASMSIFSEQIKSKSVTEILKISEAQVLTLTGTSLESKRKTCALIGYNAVRNCMFSYKKTSFS